MLIAYLLSRKNTELLKSMWIVGSVEKCTERVASREQIDIKAAIKLVHEVNDERAEYIKQLYDTDINDPSSFNITLNSDRFYEQQMVELILDAMVKAGYKLPADALIKASLDVACTLPQPMELI